jgi:hypothetical protein
MDVMARSVLLGKRKQLGVSLLVLMLLAGAPIGPAVGQEASFFAGRKFSW